MAKNTLYIFFLVCMVALSYDLPAMKRKRITYEKGLPPQKKPKGNPIYKNIFEAIAAKNVVRVKEFFDAPNFNVNSNNSKGETPLHSAIAKGDFVIAFALLDHPNINVNRQDAGGQSILHYAVAGPSTQQRCHLIFLLMKKGANPATQATNGSTPLHTAIANNFPAAIITMLVKHPSINLNAQDEKGLTPLHVATQQENTPVIKILSEAGAFLTPYNFNYETPLHIVAKKIVHSLISSHPVPQKQKLRNIHDVFSKKNPTSQDLPDQHGKTTKSIINDCVRFNKLNKLYPPPPVNILDFFRSPKKKPTPTRRNQRKPAPKKKAPPPQQQKTNTSQPPK